MMPNAVSVLSHMTIHSVALASSSVSLGISVPPSSIDTLDNSIREELQGTSHMFFLWVLISAGLVAVGCILEGPEILHELFPGLTRCFTWQSEHKLRSFEKKVKKIAAVGWLFICLGVLGEGLFELLQNRAEGQFQTFNDILLEDAKRQTTDAVERAGDAAASAKTARGAAGAAQRKADAADMTALRARGKANAVDAKAGELDKHLDDEIGRLNVVGMQLAASIQEAKALEDSLAPRRLFFITYEDGSTNVDMLKPIADTELIIESVPDLEARRAAREIFDVLTLEGHFKVVRTAITENATVSDGVTIESYMGPPIPAATPPLFKEDDMRFKEVGEEMASGDRAERMRAFLWANLWKGVCVMHSNRGELKPDQLRIRVGYKPSPFFGGAGAAISPELDAMETRILMRYAQPINTIHKKIKGIESWGISPFPEDR